MKRRSTIGIALLSVIYLVGCGSIGQPPPPVTAEMTKVHKKSKERQTSVAELQAGRTLFVSRCIECHTLPPVWHYTNKEWPHLVDTMAHRANLKPEERNAVVAYILAARAQ